MNLSNRIYRHYHYSSNPQRTNHLLKISEQAVIQIQSSLQSNKMIKSIPFSFGKYKKILSQKHMISNQVMKSFGIILEALISFQKQKSYSLPKDVLPKLLISNKKILIITQPQPQIFHITKDTDLMETITIGCACSVICIYHLAT